MPGKRVQFDQDTWQTIQAVCEQTGSTFQELAAEAIADLLKKHHQPVGFMAALEQSLGWAGKAIAEKEGWSAQISPFAGPVTPALQSRS